MALGARKAQVLHWCCANGAVLVRGGTALGFLERSRWARMLSAVADSIFTYAFNVATDYPALAASAAVAVGRISMSRLLPSGAGSAKIDPLKALRGE